MMGMMNFGNYGGDWNSLPAPMQQMMQNYYGGLAPFGSMIGAFHVITWLLLMALVVAATRYLWLKGGK